MEEKKLQAALAMLTAEVLNLRRRVSVLEEKDPDLDEEEALEVIAQTLEFSRAELYALLRRHQE